MEETQGNLRSKLWSGRTNTGKSPHLKAIPNTTEYFFQAKVSLYEMCDDRNYRIPEYGKTSSNDILVGISKTSNGKEKFTENLLKGNRWSRYQTFRNLISLEWHLTHNSLVLKGKCLLQYKWRCNLWVSRESGKSKGKNFSDNSLSTSN